jgi:alginate O-acetyltransferase complex protein AlgI
LWMQILVNNAVIMFSWALFRAPSLKQGVEYWASMLGLAHPAATSPLLHAELFTPRNIAAIAICALFVRQPLQAHEIIKKGLSVPKLIACTVVFIIAVCMMFTQTYNPFLYFQF